MKHKLKRIFNSRMLSRALITVITCSIIFSYAVLCPQADSSEYIIYSNAPGFFDKISIPEEYMGKSLYDDLPFSVLDFFYYDPTPLLTGVDFYSTSGVSISNSYWYVNTFRDLLYFPDSDLEVFFDFRSDGFDYVGVAFQSSDSSEALYFIEDDGSNYIYKQVYLNGDFNFKTIYLKEPLYFNPYSAFDQAIFVFFLSNFTCASFPTFANANNIYSFEYVFPDNIPNRNILNISFSVASPVNYSSDSNVGNFNADLLYSVFVSSEGSFYELPVLNVIGSDLVGVDDYTGVEYYYNSYDALIDLSSFTGKVDSLVFFLNLATFIPGNDVGYDSACIFISEFEYEFLEFSDQLIVSSINNITSKLEETNQNIVSIQNTLTNVTPEMQQSLDSLETLIQDEAGKVEDVINGMDQIGTDFGTEIGDFDNILNENAGTLEDIGSTTYNSFINDVFGNWFFVSMFALFGAFAFFSRAVFG